MHATSLFLSAHIPAFFVLVSALFPKSLLWLHAQRCNFDAASCVSTVSLSEMSSSTALCLFMPVFVTSHSLCFRYSLISPSIPIANLSNVIQSVPMLPQCFPMSVSLSVALTLGLLQVFSTLHQHFQSDPVLLFLTLTLPPSFLRLPFVPFFSFSLQLSPNVSRVAMAGLGRFTCFSSARSARIEVQSMETLACPLDNTASCSHFIEGFDSGQCWLLVHQSSIVAVSYELI